MHGGHLVHPLFSRHGTVEFYMCAEAFTLVSSWWSSFSAPKWKRRIICLLLNSSCLLLIEQCKKEAWSLVNYSLIDDICLLSWFTGRKGTNFSLIVICRFELFFERKKKNRIHLIALWFSTLVHLEVCAFNGFMLVLF